MRPRADTVYVARGRSVLVTGLDGFIAPSTPQGFFQHQARLLCRYRWLVDGAVPTPAGLAPIDPHSWLGYYAVELDREAPERNEAPGTLELRLMRVVGGGLREEAWLENHHHRPTRHRIELEVDADFADVSTVDQGESKPRVEVRREWRDGGDAWELGLACHVEHDWEHDGRRGRARMDRGATIRFRAAGTPMSYADGRVAFTVALAPHARWTACIDVIPTIDGRPLETPVSGNGARRGDVADIRRGRFLDEATRFEADPAPPLARIVERTAARAIEDLATLRLDDLDENERDWVPAAGLPVYVTLFGRDTVTAAWQAALVGPSMMRGTLPVIARTQGREVDDWRDEQPGRLLHQADQGPLATLEMTPFGRYYGTVTMPAFFPIVLSELWHWTGDRALVGRLLATAREALGWLDRYGDLDGDGIYEYETSSSGGLRNQGWKDSGNAIVHEDASLARPPIATCEEQAFAYLAKFRMAEVLGWFDGREDAVRLHREAGELKRRFNDRFWMDDERFYAMGLDGDKRRISSISSDVGIALSTGILDDARVPRTVERLFADDLYSGWGIRTLSSGHAAYDPFSYQRGSVWPVEQAAVALGLARYGMHEPLARLCRAQFELASLYDHCRLPEVFAGHARDADHPFPGVYRRANWPQAWSASSVFCLLQAMTGLYPYAPLHLLLLDPHLPGWLPALTVRGLHVGDARVDIRFERDARGTTDYRVLDVRGPLRVIRQPSPWSFTAGAGERIKDALASLLPGH